MRIRQCCGAAWPAREVAFDIQDAQGMGVEDESVIRVGVRYNYQSVLTELFGGGVMAIEKVRLRAAAYRTRRSSLDGATDDGGAITYLTIS